MTSRADVLNVARGYVSEGVREQPPGSNRTIIGERFGWNGVAWCAEFVTVCEHEGGNDSFQGSASCSVLVGRYQDGTNGTWLGGAPESGAEGFLGSRGQDHTILVELVEGSAVHSIEGNWGDRVCRVTRDASEFYGFGLPVYDDGPQPGVLPPPSATTGRPVLRNGSTGQWVSNLQTVLGPATNLPCTVDGGFGDETQAALEAYQTARGLTVDGICGPETWGDIDKVLAYVAATQISAPAGTVEAVPAPHDIPEFPGSIQKGSHGDVVTTWQNRLVERGWNIGTLDGIDGDKTTAALTQFQEQAQGQGYYADTVDGIGGPNTWVALYSAPIT